MSEKFTNYMVSVNFTSSNKKATVVPRDGVTLPVTGETLVGNSGTTRDSGSVCQIHSIYITKSDVSSYVTNPESNGVYLSIYVQDNVKSTKFYVAKFINVLPNSSFYIEKTITLRAQDSLVVAYEGTSSQTVDIVCSSVDMT